MNAETIELKNASLSDVGAMALVLARANAQRDGEVVVPTQVDETEVSMMRQRMGKIDAWAYTAVAEERVAGFALGYPSTEEVTTVMDAEYLALLMVDPVYWGRGVARMLINKVATQAHDAGKSWLTLWTGEKNNAHARGMYEHIGFVSAGRTRHSPYGRQVYYRLSLLTNTSLLNP